MRISANRGWKCASRKGAGGSGRSGVGGGVFEGGFAEG